MKTKTKRVRCTCGGSEYDDPKNHAYDRHEPECTKAPDVTSWLWYPHDGELEDGGVYINPVDPSVIYLLVKGYLCRTPLSSTKGAE